MLEIHTGNSWQRTSQAARTALTHIDVTIWESNTYKNTLNLLNFHSSEEQCHTKTRSHKMQIAAMKKDICYWSTEEKGKEIQDN